MVEEHAAELPVRNVRDPQILRALAHPARIRLLEELAFAGPSTATDLAERVGESPAHCSWHLRQLARYGFVEEAGGGRGRQRPWRVVVQSNEWPQGDDDTELALAGDAATEVLFGREYAALRQWRTASHTDTAEWRSAPFVTQSMGWLTAEELTEVGKEVTRILMRYVPRLADPATRPEGARPVRLVAWGIPARVPAPDEPPPPPVPDRTPRATEPTGSGRKPAPANRARVSTSDVSARSVVPEGRRRA